MTVNDAENLTPFRVKTKAFDPDKWVYDQSTDTLFRYSLGTRGARTLVCFGINPSTASPEDLDNTVLLVEKRALNSDYDSFMMFNIYAQRATNPDHMDKVENLEVSAENIKVISRLINELCAQQGHVDIWAAWGTNVEKRAYLRTALKKIYAIMVGRNCNWLHVGELTKAGHPRHPLYLPRNLPFLSFDIKAYLKSL